MRFLWIVALDSDLAWSFALMGTTQPAVDTKERFSGSGTRTQRMGFSYGWALDSALIRVLLASIGFLDIKNCGW